MNLKVFCITIINVLFIIHTEPGFVLFVSIKAWVTPSISGNGGLTFITVAHPASSKRLNPDCLVTSTDNRIFQPLKAPYGSPIIP